MPIANNLKEPVQHLKGNILKSWELDRKKTKIIFKVLHDSKEFIYPIGINGGLFTYGNRLENQLITDITYEIEDETTQVAWDIFRESHSDIFAYEALTLHSNSGKNFFIIFHDSSCFAPCDDSFFVGFDPALKRNCIRRFKEINPITNKVKP